MAAIFQSNTSSSEPKRRRASNVNSMYRYCGSYIPEKVLPNTSCHDIHHFGGHFQKKWRPFFKVIRVIFENMKVNRHSGVYVSFFGNIIQIAYCYVHHTMVGTIWRAVVAICSNCGNLF